MSYSNGGMLGGPSNNVVNGTGSGIWNQEYVYSSRSNGKWLALGTQKKPASSAIELRDAGYDSGLYYINWGGTPYQVYCEMDLGGGGWIMILNYVHKGGTNPSLDVKSSSFPTLSSEFSLGSDESGLASWGHLSNSLANQYNWTEYMFYGKTSGHSRQIHFSGSVGNVVSYIKTGSGSMSGIATRNDLSLHSANLPGSANSYYSDQGDLAMTQFSMYKSGSHHWGVGAGSRWEVDDYPNGPGNDTIHRIWVR